tara:strand:+ start:24 stop:218 length:195 start_codon:yes stop_codon:yes gene_type:complete
VYGKLERAESYVRRGKPMSCKVNDEWFERAYEEHYDKLKAKGLSDQEIDKFITEMFYNESVENY